MSDSTPYTVPGIPERGLKPAAELAANKPHGTRIKYVGGCRCADCRKANSTYANEREKARRRGELGLVDTAAAVRHMRKLSLEGVGYKTVSAATDISTGILTQILNGSRTHITARNAKKILAVTTACRADHALISAEATHKLLRELIEEGYTKQFLAKQLGYKNRALQFRAQTITVKNAARIAALHKRLTT